MREIKFRAWNPNPGFMTAGVTLADIYNGFAGLNGRDVMQYTGLKDKNGVEIYEGDVLFHSNHNVKTEMKWIDNFACFSGVDEGDNNNYYQRIDEKHLEIIGNIFENPNLFKNV